ncbi:hypothetical protein ACNASG_21220 [Klebsiella pneumoniae]|uniref:hypothetical protein n=1 Tax=Klebsiella pneumoniae TaxID=573 RepID=UPI002A0117EF|nr:hypothetical protein [Klebsiella pneumoniae]EJD3766331.1 hypothetical protein [Klebsiella pneumoniae]MCJ4736969.1 hypothetical protein [Klebsiella pneumoniae]
MKKYLARCLAIALVLGAVALVAHLFDNPYIEGEAADAIQAICAALAFVVGILAALIILIGSAVKLWKVGK